VQIDDDAAPQDSDRRQPTSASNNESSGNLRQGLSGLQSLVEQMRAASDGNDGSDFPPPLADAYRRLTRANVPHQSARELVGKVCDTLPPTELDNAARVGKCVRKVLEAEIRTSGEIDATNGQKRVVAVVGPSGVGKTTTVAKLAAEFRLRKRRSVGLVAVDNGRVASADRLQAYAEIIDVPIETANTPGEMRRAKQRLRHQDLILVDTAGASPQCDNELQELKSLLEAIGADEVHLALSSVAAANHLERSVRSFMGVGIAALMLTKIDEADGLGHLLPVLMKVRVPISYLSVGQDVPDDLQVADAYTMIRTILGDQ
jgi:flagellar biosynthesis protein FlhF